MTQDRTARPIRARRCLWPLAAAVLAATLPTGALAQSAARGAPPPTAFVMDFSNTMNTAIGDRPRIDLTRDAIEAAMDEADPRIEVGVVAYGHRRAGDCRDVEAVVPLAPLDTEDFSTRIDPLDARGKASLDRALEAAAEMLAGIAGRSSIIVTAGAGDACGVDICARAAALEAERPALAIHVVGIGDDPAKLEPLQCLAEATGGLFQAAADAAAIDTAIRKVADGPAVAAINPTSRPGGPLDGRVFSWSVRDEVTGETVLTGEVARILRVALPRGRFVVTAEAPGATGQLVLQSDGRDQSAEMIIDSEASIDAPDSASIGVEIEVGWRGPNALGDYLSIAPVGAPLTQVDAYARVSDGNPVAMRTPRAPGAYELRYVSAAENRLLASRPLAIEAPTVTIDGPPRVSPGERFPVRWVGPGEAGDRFTVALPGDPDTVGLATPVGEDSPTDVLAPETAADYELRYLGAAGVVLARAPLKVIVPISMSADDTAVAGGTVVVYWNGPNGPGDRLTIVPADAPDTAEGRSLSTAGGAKLPLESPVTPGAAEIRYIDGISGLVMARRRITLTAPQVVFDAPDSAVAGSTVILPWTGPDNRNDLITIVPADTADSQRGNFVYTFRGNPSELVAPAAAGPAEIRYVSGATGGVLARRPITLTAPDVALDASPVATAGSTIPITWEGPDGRNDYITIVPGGTPDTQRFNYTFTRRGSPLDVVAPPGPGPAEIRYVSAQTGAVLARLPILLSQPVVTLAAPGTVTAGASVDIAWTGPDNENDYITVVAEDAPDSERGNYNFTWRGNPLPLLMPDQAGVAEIRYRAGQSGDVLARRTIRLTPPDVVLDAPDSAVAGSTVSVTWDGPDNRNDYIAIAEAGAPDDQRLEFNYTRRGNPLTVETPPTPGPAEIRYHSGQTKEVLARRPMMLTKAVVGLTAVPSALSGATISVTWQGPDERNDFLTIVPAGAPDSERGETAFTRRGNPLDVVAPLEPGPAEIRYRSGTTGEVLARAPLQLTRAEVSLEAAEIAAAGATIPVRWDGPNNRNDFITIVPEGTPDDRRLDYNFTRRGNPLPVRTPPVSGIAEIRYMSGQTGQTMARRRIELR